MVVMYLAEPCMVKGFLQRNSLNWISFKQHFYELFGSTAHFRPNAVIKTVLPLDSEYRSSFGISGAKGVFTSQSE